MKYIMITVDHPNGYSGRLYGKSSMSIFKDNKEVLHTGFRNINTASALYELLESMPDFMFMLKDIVSSNVDDDCEV